MNELATQPSTESIVSQSIQNTDQSKLPTQQFHAQLPPQKSAKIVVFFLIVPFVAALLIMVIGSVFLGNQ